jgi:hypothetical protein
MSSLPSTTEFVLLGAPIALRDGTRIRVRQGHRSDRELLVRGFERLTPESRYRRFFAPMPELSEGMVRYLTAMITTTTRRSSRLTSNPETGSAWPATSVIQSATMSPRLP